MSLSLVMDMLLDINIDISSKLKSDTKANQMIDIFRDIHTIQISKPYPNKEKFLVLGRNLDFNMNPSFNPKPNT